MDEPRNTNTNITRNKLGIRISFEEHVTAIRILFHYIRTRIITFVPPPAKSSLVHPLPPFIVNYCQMASPREPTNGPTPISLSPSLSLFPAIGVSLQIPNRVSIGWFRRPISNQISNEIRLGRNFLNISRHPRALYIYILVRTRFTNSGYPREGIRNWEQRSTTIDDL